MKTIKLTEKNLTSIIKNVINEVKFNTINYSDLTKSGDWDSRRHSRDEKGIHMYKLDKGLLKKIDKHPNVKIGYHKTVNVFYLTDKEFDKANELLLKARDLESQAKEYRAAANFIMKSGIDEPYV